MEIFKLFGSIFVDNDKANKAIDETDQKAEATSGTFGKLGAVATKMGGLLAAGATVAGTAITGLMSKTMQTANEINKFSQVTGMSTKGFQEWDYVAKSLGYSMEAASGDLAALAERAMDAASGAGENAEMFKLLGVSVKDSNGQLKSQEQLFNETIAGLQSMEDVTKRNAIATAMLSTTGEELAPVLNMTNAELQKMKSNANIISDEDLKKAAVFNEKWNQAKSTMSNVVSVIGFGVMPIFQKMLDWVIDHMPQIQSATEVAFNAVSNVVTGVSAFFKDNFLPVLNNIWTFFKDNIVPIFSKFYSDQSKNMPLVQNIISTAFSGIKEWATTVWKFFKENVLPIFLDLYSWVQGHMPTLRATFEAAFQKITEVARNAWAFYKENFMPILASLFDWVQANMPQIKNIIETAFRVIKNVVEIAWGIFENLLLPALKKLWEWIEPHMPEIKKAVKENMDAVVKTVQTVVDIFETVTGAIKKAIDWLGQWNDKPAQKKTVEVEERRTTGGISGGIPNHYVGTRNFEGGATWVGEHGPEIVELPRGSKIHSANDSKAIAPSQTIVVESGAVNILASSVKEFNDVIDFFKRLPQVAKQY